MGKTAETEQTQTKQQTAQGTNPEITMITNATGGQQTTDLFTFASGCSAV